MKKAFLLTLVLFTALALCAQTAALSPELQDFKAFIEEHPVALAELKKNPALLGTPEFAKSHRRVGEYIAAHPKLVEEVKANPKFVEGLTAKSAGGGGHRHEQN